MEASYEPKLIYLARRNTGLSREAFTDRWRQHGRLGMSMPRWANIARYVHCDVIEPLPSERLLLGDHDGIGMIWHKSPEHRAAHIADRSSRAAMEADEAATFSRPIVETCLVAREFVLTPVAAVGTVKLTRFVLDGTGSASPARSRGHVVNHPLPAETEAGWGLKCTLIEEFWFDSRQHAVDAAARLTEDGNAIFVVSNEVLLYP